MVYLVELNRGGKTVKYIYRMFQQSSTHYRYDQFPNRLERSHVFFQEFVYKGYTIMGQHVDPLDENENMTIIFSFDDP